MTTQRSFTWAPRFDERSRAYSVRPTGAPRTWTWPCATYLDQGTEGACVGYAFAHEIAAEPYPHPATAELASSIYHEAQKVDEWPGEDYSGTSVLAGVKTATRLGYYSGYRWAFTPSDAIRTISWQGPAVIGIFWHEGMINPDPAGYIHKTGKKVGGHAILVNAVNASARTVSLHNSWGPKWGINGNAFMTWDTFAACLRDSGECCFPTRR